MMNDPARGGVHSNDVAIFRPVWVDNRVELLTATLVHVADLGGVSGGGLPAQATEIYHEGLLIPPLPLYRDGEVNEVVSKIIRLNSRTPEKVMGDIRALVAGVNVGASRLEALIVRHGPSVVIRAIAKLLDYTEARMRAGIERLPEGPISAESEIDDDGIDPTVAYKVRVTLTRHGSNLTIDLGGTSPAAKGAINASHSQAMSGLVYGIRCFVDPTMPLNEGVFRPLQPVLPSGSLANPGPRAAVNARIVTVLAIIEAMRTCLSKPDFGIATSGLVHMQVLTGQYSESGKIWVVMDLDFGGIGARAGADGPDATGHWTGRSSIAQIEPIEAEFPILFERHALIADSGGAGTWRGGLGVERTIQVLVDAEVSVRGDRMKNGPPGAAGGQPGRGGSWIVNLGRDDETRLPGKRMGVRLRAGDTLTLRTSGGGGYGPPEGRPPEKVRGDVVAGYVSVGEARETYRVSLGGPTFEIDDEETQMLRTPRIVQEQMR
jgi:N-methylhydantoinase B